MGRTKTGVGVLRLDWTVGVCSSLYAQGLWLLGPTQNEELAFKTSIKKIKSVVDAVLFTILFLPVFLLFSQNPELSWSFQ